MTLATTRVGSGERRPPGSSWALAAAVVIAFGVTIRILYLFHAVGLEGYNWDDPDHYARKAIELASEDSGWRWSFDAVSHEVSGRRYVLPPLYPAFLSLFAAFPGFPLSAQIGQILLSACAMACLFLLGRGLHSEKAGVLATLLYCAWLPDVIAVWSTMQEALYVPLVLVAFVLLFRGLAGESSVKGLLPAGIVFGFAALTRSMPLYFLPVLALLVWNRRRAAGLAVGFLAVTLPYSVALSLHLGRVTLIENHGGIRILESYGEMDREGEGGDHAPSVIATGVSMVKAVATRPRSVLAEWDRAVRSLFHVNGGRLLQIYLGADTKLDATIRKIFVHTFADGLLIAVTLLAPFGMVLCRDSRGAWMLAAWVVLNVGLTMVSGFGGARLRAPFTPHLILLAAVSAAGDWRRTSWMRFFAAGGVALVLASILVPQLPASLSAKGDYGVHWPMNPVPKRSAMIGEAGFSVLSTDQVVEFALRPRNGVRATRVEVLAEGAPVEVAVIDGDEQEHRFRFGWPALELVHVELRVSDLASGEPVRGLVIVPRR